MINQIKSINPNYNIINVFKHLSDEYDRKTKSKGVKKTKKEKSIDEGKPFIKYTENRNDCLL